MSTELTKETNTELDLTTFAKLYNDSISNHNDETNNNYIPEIIDILGGIDNIIKTYINISMEYKDSNILNADQMNKIYSIISRTNEQQNGQHQETHHMIQSEEINIIQTDESTENSTLYFYKNATFLHSICCNDQIADKFISFVFNKYITGFTSIVSLIWTVGASFWPNAHTVTWFVVFELTWECIMIIYILSLILSCNRKAFMLVTKTFDFWMKFYYAFGAMVANSIYIRCLNFEFYHMLYIDISSVIVTLVVVLFSLFEGYHTTWKIIFTFGVVVSSIISMQAIRFTFFYEGPESEMEIIPGTGMKIGLLAYFAAAYRIMSLFLWKQTIMSAWTRGTSCISIYVTPKMVWVEDNIQEQLTR